MPCSITSTLNPRPRSLPVTLQPNAFTLSRAPSPRVPPVPKRRSLSGIGLDSQRYAGARRMLRYFGGVRCRQKPCRHELHSSLLWGAPRLRAAAPLPSLLAPLLPFRGAISFAFPRSRCPPSSDCANARPTRRARDSGLPFRSPGCSRGSPALSLRRAPSLSSSPGFVLPAVALAPPPWHLTRAEWQNIIRL